MKTYILFIGFSLFLNSAAFAAGEPPPFINPMMGVPYGSPGPWTTLPGSDIHITCPNVPVAKPKQAGECTAPQVMYCDYDNAGCGIWDRMRPINTNPNSFPGLPNPIPILGRIQCDPKPDGSCYPIDECVSAKLSDRTKGALFLRANATKNSKTEESEITR